MNRFIFVRPVAIAMAAIFSLLLGAFPAMSYSPAYDSKITGRIVGPDGLPADNMDVIVHTEADKPYGQGDQDMSARTVSDSNGRFSFLADSRTVYKVRIMDSYGGSGRKPFTFADKWVGGESTFDDQAGYASAREIVFQTPGVVQLATESVTVSDLPPFSVSSKPTIIGEPVAGQELFATPGLWSPVPLGGWKFTWYLGQNWIGEGQAITLPVTFAGLGPIRVVASAAQWGVGSYTEASSDGLMLRPLELPEPGVSISGLAQVGNKLSAGLAIPAGMSASELYFMTAPQWYRNGFKISGAETLTYEVTAEDLGAVLSFKAGQQISHSPAETLVGAPGRSPVFV